MPAGKQNAKAKTEQADQPKPRRPIGHPRIIKSVEEFQQLSDQYFSDCDQYHEPYTVTGLALAVGVASRQGLMDYERRAEYHDAVKRSKMRVEHQYEVRLSTPQPTGAIFALKNLGWSDLQQIQQLEAPKADLDLAKLTDEQLTQLDMLQRIARGEVAQPVIQEQAKGVQ